MSKSQGVWFLALLGLFVSCLSASWLLQAQFHYGYSVWYKVFDIEQHIHTFAPQNPLKHGFELLRAKEHIQLFNQISEAVHQHGQGLADISYPAQPYVVPLLTRAEIIHLQDVARLIEVLERAALSIAVTTLLLLLGVGRLGSRPQLKTQLFAVLALVLGMTMLVLLVGPERVFYQLHVWIFPDKHQWFFYYQESLMSTLMKAPDLFAGIAVAIGAGGLLLFGLSLGLGYQLLGVRRVN